MVKKRKTKSKILSSACKGMDRISGLSDDLLVKILSFLPTKVAISTSLLSKRWEFLWLWLPKLKFVSRWLLSEGKSLRLFLDRNLPLHEAPVIESFHLNFASSCFSPEDIKLWLVIALSRHLRKLKIIYDPNSYKPNILPSSLYTCKSLVTLKLRGMIRLDVPRRVCLPSLKTLQLLLEKYFDAESLQRLLSICPVLEDLEVHFDSQNDNMDLLTINVPSLQSLSLFIPSDGGGLFHELLVINTPSLRYLKLQDLGDDGHPFFIKNMPNLEDAHLRYCDISSYIGSITSVKGLTICSETVYGDGFVFNQLEDLTLCVCTRESNLLVRLLEDSPNLRVLDIVVMDHYGWEDEDPPITVDECILSSLKTYNWSGYLGRRPREKDLAVYILGKRWSLQDCNNLV